MVGAVTSKRWWREVEGRARRRGGESRTASHGGWRQADGAGRLAVAEKDGSYRGLRRKTVGRKKTTCEV